MSVRTVHLSPEVTRPIAMPPIISLIGTPASMSASVDPHVDAIDDEPFDSSVSLTTRIVYGNSSFVGRTGRIARSASAPWPISRRPAPRIMRTSPTENGGEVVMVMYPLVSTGEAVAKMLHSPPPPPC